MRVLVLTDAIDHVSYRYRFQQFATLLAEMDTALVPVSWVRGVLARWHQCVSLPKADVCVIQRRLVDRRTLQILRYRYPRLVYDFDDAVVFRDSHSRKGFRSVRRAERFRRIVRTVDTVIAGNRYLGGLAATYGGQDIRVIPTCVDTSRYEPCLKNRRSGPDRRRCVWIGSSSTLPYLEALRNVFRRLQQRHQDLVLRVICDRFPLWSGVRIEARQWTAADEARLLSGADIGIAPLTLDPWSHGKCGLKTLQYMAAGLPVVATNAGVHSDLVVHGVTGFLVSDEQEWLEALETLLSDPALLQSMGEHGRARAVTHYDTRRWVGELYRALKGGEQGGHRSAA